MSWHPECFKAATGLTEAKSYKAMFRSNCQARSACQHGGVVEAGSQFVYDTPATRSLPVKPPYSPSKLLSKEEVLFLVNIIDRDSAEMEDQDKADALLERVAKKLHSMTIAEIRSDLRVAL